MKTRHLLKLDAWGLGALLLVAGCSAQTKVDKMESVKAPDVTQFPTVISVIQQTGVDFDEQMKTLIVAESSKCGVSVKFFYYNNYKADEFYARSQGVMSVKQLNSDTTTKSSLSYNSSFTGRATYEFTLEDKTSHKNVWRARMDFDQADPRDNFHNQMRGETSPSTARSNGLLSLMKKDGVLGSCRS